jgi:serine/threonine protein kinase
VSNKNVENFSTAQAKGKVEFETEPQVFDVVRRLGKGSYGSVYSISRNNEFKALKKQEFYDDSDGGIVSGTLREFLFYRLFKGHPNVLTCDKSWRIGKYLFTTMPMYSCTAKTLARSNISFNDFVYLVKSISAGLECMHDNEWMHRDIKMENILVDEELGACLADFNLVRWAHGGTLTDSLRGSLQLRGYASSHICTLWTRAPEVVLAEIAGKKHCSYGIEFDMFSLGCTLLAVAAGDYCYGNTLIGYGGTELERYLTAYMEGVGTNEQISAAYPGFSQGRPPFSSCEERLLSLFPSTLSWTNDERDQVASLLKGLLHPLPLQRSSWKEVNEWLSHYTVSEWSESLKTFLCQHKAAIKIASGKLDKVVETAKIQTPLVKRPPISMGQFWTLCGTANIPPAFACEALRLKFNKPFCLQESQGLLFILDCLHNYSSSIVCTQLCLVSPEDIWAAAKHLPPLRADILRLGMHMKAVPFKMCCLASEVALTGTCDSPERIEDSKIIHLSTAAPFFGAYGAVWKAQLAMRSTWFRLFTQASS